MRYDTIFTNGVIKSREKFLLGDKLERMVESTPEEAFKLLKEGGFGGESAVATDVDADALIRAEECAVNAFIREYAPDEKTEAFLLAEYDFHNAEALIKCKYAGASEEKTLAEEGLYTVEDLKKAIEGEQTSKPINKILLSVILDTAESFNQGKANGFTVDCAFKKALFEYMRSFAKNKKLKSILEDRADVANVSSALRSRDFALAEKMFVCGGKLPISRIKELCELAYEDIEAGDYDAWIKEAAASTGKGRPLSEAEKKGDDFGLELLYLTRYDMVGVEPFILYVLRRRAEIRNARIIIVSLSAGLSPVEIRNKMRKY